MSIPVVQTSAVTFVQLDDAQLQQMDLSSLKIYYDQVSAVIAKEFSTIADAQAVQSQYDYLILSSQSTINGLDYEITTNSNLIISADVNGRKIIDSNIILDSTIATYTSTIAGHNKTILDADTKISTLMTESDSISISLAKSDKDFVSSAIYYSSLYNIFIEKDIAYQAGVSNIINTSTLLSNAIVKQKASYSNWQTSSAYTTARTAELEQLYISSNDIQKALTQYKIDEIKAISDYTSTIDSVKALSSMYETSIVNQKYYQSLSSQSGILDTYTAAYSTFQTASALSNASPGNTLVAAAATMAQQRLSTLTIAKGQAMEQTTKLQGLVANAVTDTYSVQLAAAEDAVQREISIINLYQNYATSSIAAVTYYSSQYETANKQVISSLFAISTYSSFYESSVIGSNSFMNKVIDDNNTIKTQQAQLDDIKLSIISLTKEYGTYESSYNGWIGYSTTMKTEVDKYQADLRVYSTLYESTSDAIVSFTNKLSEVNNNINSNNTVIRTQSTIFEKETINYLMYQNQIQTSFNTEENAVFQYRETYINQNLKSQNDYLHACILQEQQNNSTNNAILVLQAAGKAVVPIPLNINTPVINAATSNVQSITYFLNTFKNIYNNYNTQAGNLQSVSTSIVGQMVSFSNVTTQANAYLTYPDPQHGQAFSNAQIDFIGKQTTTQNLQTRVALTQTQIDTAKIAFMQTYNKVFQSSDIFNNESTISSFLIQGFKSAVIV